MRSTLLILSLALAACARVPATSDTAPAVTARTEVIVSAYPQTRTVDQVDEYHGTAVKDPYRWLEQLDASETRAWIDAQNQLTQQYLAQIPQRARVHARMTELWNFERYGIPTREGDRYLLQRNDGLQNQSVLYTLDRLDGEPKLLLDPNTLSADGTVALTGTEVSPNGRLLAYSVANGGSDWQEWRVRDIASARDLTDWVQWNKFSGIAWAADSSGFYYGRYAEPLGQDKLKALNENQSVYFHRLGTPQSADPLIYQRPDQPKWGFELKASEDGRYLLMSVSQGTDERNRFFYLDLSQPGAKVQELIADLEASYAYIGNAGTQFWFRTNLDAPRYRVIRIDVAHPAKSGWKTVIAQDEAPLVGTTLVGDQFIGQYLLDARSEVRRFTLDGKPLGALDLPGLGSAAGFAGKRSDSETFYSYTSFTVPTDIYRLDLKTGQSTLFRRAQSAFNPDLYETRQVRYTSKDGTQVPMFITARKGLPLNGQQPTLLYGYGGFNIPVLPTYSVPMATWLDQGGVYAVANLRGGGEYGETWHAAGTKLQKQSVFDDFIAAAEYLIAAKYTQPSKLAIYGRSNGGLLTGATLLQRPDLFAAALPTVGVLDMLRFNQFTIGWAWESDYGTVKDPDEFRALLAYSPLHNIREGVAYPPTLITTADRDDRVYPAHSFKFAAALQHAQAGERPVLIRIETKAGHGAGKPTTKVIDESADKLAFVIKVFGLDLKLD